MKVAVLNAGSGTIKAALMDVEAAATTVCARQMADLTPGTDTKSAVSAALEALGSGDGGRRRDRSGVQARTEGRLRQAGHL